jgi:hypothetical protein
MHIRIVLAALDGGHDQVEQREGATLDVLAKARDHTFELDDHTQVIGSCVVGGVAIAANNIAIVWCRIVDTHVTRSHTFRLLVVEVICKRVLGGSLCLRSTPLRGVIWRGVGGEVDPHRGTSPTWTLHL